MLRSLAFPAVLTAAVSFVAAAPVPLRPETFFITPGQASTVAWTTDVAGGTASPVPYTVLDYEGRKVASGVATPDAGAPGRLSVSVTLPRGYHEIRLGEGASASSYGLVVQDAFAGPADPFFGVDAVITWLERRAELRESMVKMIKRSGIGLSRERFRWSGVNPAPDKWNWNETDQADALRGLYKQEGVPVLEMFHDAGPARGSDTVTSRYPRDLVALSHSWPAVHERWRDTWAGIEVWNEPDGPTYGSSLPADQYLPFVKAMRWTFQQAGITAPLGGGVLIGSDPGDYHRNLVENGLLDHVDFVSFHDYRRAAEMAGLISLYRRWMKESGREGMPLWLTEVGYPWSKGPGRAPLAEDQRSAAEITMKGIEARACGIARFMPFCLPFYEEGGVKNFAMLGREATPLRSMAAYAQSIRVLAHRPYAGDLRLADSKAVSRARVFAGRGEGGDTESVVVLFTDKLSLARIVLPFAPSRAETIDGRPLAVEAGNVVIVAGGLAYVWGATDALSAHVDTHTEAAALTASSRVATPPAPAASPVVLWHRINGEQVLHAPTRYLIGEDEAAKLSLSVRATNLSIKPKRIRIGLTLPGEPSGSAREQSVTVPAEGTSDIVWTVDARGALDIARTLPLVVSGVTEDDGLPLAPVAAPFRIEGTVERFAAKFPDHVALAVDRLSRWEKNVTHHGSMDLASPGPGAWRLDARFRERGERWAYPKYRLDPAQLGGARGLVIRLRAKEKAELRLMMFAENGAGYWTSIPFAPADGRWHVAYIPFSEFEPLPSHADPDGGKLDLGRIASLAVGLHDHSPDRNNTLEVSHLLLIKETASERTSSSTP